METLFCEDAAPVFFNLLDFSIAPPLLYYAYVPILILTLIFAAIALHYNKRDLISKNLAFLAVSLWIFVIFTFFQWIAAPVSLVMFSWEMWCLSFALLFLSTTSFIYVFITGKKVPNVLTLLFLLPLIPIILLTPTKLNIEWFDMYWCEGVMNTLFLNYTYTYCIALMLFISGLGIYLTKHKKKTDLTKKQIWLTIGGALSFLFLFFITTYIGDITGIYEFEVLGPIGAMAFIACVSYVSVNYRRFEINLLGSELLIIALLVVTGSMFFVDSLDYVRYVSIGSLAMIALVGWTLAKSIRREHEQREEIEKLAVNLEKANDKLKVLDKLKSEFVSIASHQLRTPLTSIRGYASMILDGTYGKVPAKAQEAIQRIADSSHFMATSVEDYLNVSRIQAGNMKYEMSDFNLKDLAKKMSEDMRRQAMSKGLLLTFKSDLQYKGIVNADIGKTRQILQNLLNNAIKYTEKGAINIIVRDSKRPKQIFVDVVDTGVGMNPETIDEMFEKFERADDANKVNTTGTGLGLYIARKMAEEMGGDIIATSDGEGEGSQFTLVLPLQI